MSCGSLYRGACRRAYGCVSAYVGAGAEPGVVPGRIRTSLATPRPPDADQSGGEAPLAIGYCLRRCQGAPPKSGSNGSKPGGVPERPKGADCKSAGSAFPGSNPGAATSTKRPPLVCGNADQRGSLHVPPPSSHHQGERPAQAPPLKASMRARVSGWPRLQSCRGQGSRTCSCAAGATTPRCARVRCRGRPRRRPISSPWPPAADSPSR